VGAATAAATASSIMLLLLLQLGQGAQAFVPPSLLPTTGTTTAARSNGAAAALTTTTAATAAMSLQPLRLQPFFGRRRARLTQLRMSAKGANNNQMSPEAYTEKAWDAITRLPQLATRFEAQYIDTEMLLKSLLEDGPGALANRVFFKAGLKVPALESDLDAYIAGQPKVPDAQNKVRVGCAFVWFAGRWIGLGGVWCVRVCELDCVVLGVLWCGTAVPCRLLPRHRSSPHFHHLKIVFFSFNAA
jgi:hypothetical protein